MYVVQYQALDHEGMTYAKNIEQVEEIQQREVLALLEHVAADRLESVEADVKADPDYERKVEAYGDREWYEIRAACDALWIEARAKVAEPTPEGEAAAEVGK